MTKILKDACFLTAGCLIMAYSIIAFWSPHNIVTGGVSGLGIIIEYTWGIPIWLTNIVLNIPLFLLGFKTMGRGFFIKSAITMALFTASLYVVDFLPLIEADRLISTIFGGVLAGIGMGLVFTAMSSTGGTTLAASIIKHVLAKHWSIGKILFFIEGLIILTGVFVFGPVMAMYAIVAIFVCTKVTDAILEGMSYAKAAFIISDHTEKIAAQIIEKMDRGATELMGRGMYTKNAKNVLLCVVSAKELVNLKALVHSQDPQAFVIVTDIKEVLGEGFRHETH